MTRTPTVPPIFNDVMKPVIGPGNHALHADLLARAEVARDALSGQTAIVTGAGRGIGREAARALAWLGANVVIAELDKPSGAEVERTIRADGGRALFAPTDVSSESDVHALAQHTRATFGSADILINNAIAINASLFVDMDLAAWDRVIAVNLRGAFLTCKAFLPDMLARKRGTIVNMISTDAMPGLSAYIASKQGLNGFTQSLAAEVGDQGVQVIAFGPGMVDTPGIRSAAGMIAPLLGMSEAHMLGMSLHPAFEGMMPAEYAGVATAVLVARFADEYHGDATSGYVVLERAGVITAPSPQPESDPPTTVPAQDAMSVAHALEGSRALQDILAKTESEFNQMPIFVRPLARNGFKSKTGRSAQEWMRAAKQLTDQLQTAAQNGSDSKMLAPIRAQTHRDLNGLRTYYAAMPAETARFTRDANLLREVERMSRERLGVIDSLDCALGMEG